MKIISSISIAFRQWFFTSLVLAAGLMVCTAVMEGVRGLMIGFGILIGSLACSLPVFLVLTAALPGVKFLNISWRKKIAHYFLLQMLIISGYAVIAGFLNPAIINHSMPLSMLVVFLVLSTASLLAMLANLSKVILFFDGHFPVNISYGQLVLLLFNQYSPKYTTMETEHTQHPVNTQSNRLLIKGLITGGLILLMLIPGLFITSLVKEREERHKEVVKEVSSKWAGPQTISGPYLVVPYLSSVTNADGTVSVSRSPLIVLPENLDASAQLVPEKRPRSIYKVLLYKSAVAIKGNFKANWPQDINPLNVDLANAKICFGLSDFKGIEDDIYVNIGKEKMLLNPGLPVDDLGKTGLMSTLPLTPEMMASGVPFEMNVSLRGSGQFRFMPLAASSKFKMISSWPDPSFDGNTLPDNDRVVNDKGFSAKWNFNRANLPFGTVLQPGQFVDPSLSFGVSLVQVADQYNKTMRSVKYAILFVGLTFALFFIVEILQRKPFHPVQYVLVGLALTIFYSLLLSFSEYILFDQAYLIAAAATILLISLYAKGHFQSWKTAAVFAGVLCCLYGFIFTLIRLEDNALIVGSIGLFIVLALVMYVSRKINWYGQPHSTTAIQI